MKILLINPPTRNIITTTQASFVVKERGFVPPLGLLYLASSIQTKSKHQIKIIDCQLHDLTVAIANAKWTESESFNRVLFKVPRQILYLYMLCYKLMHNF